MQLVTLLELWMALLQTKFLAQMHLYSNKFADLPKDQNAANVTVELLPKKLDEEVAAGMVGGFGGVMTVLTDDAS